ncbi:hypothetical protein CY35_02G046700 [Sphagnum magellanicum]|nr:hypothetical protein CY35_02G046700 [Sphagnum magellanicum]
MVASRSKPLSCMMKGMWIQLVISLLFYSCTLSLAILLHPSPADIAVSTLDIASNSQVNNLAGVNNNNNKRKLTARIYRELHRLNKPPVKTIQSLDGDLIDCVLSTSQPAFDHPLLKNHTIERPPAIPKNFKSGTLLTQKQIWHESGECPIGTIPVRRTLAKDILQAGSIHNYRKKKGGLSAVPKPSSATILQSSHEHAIAYIQGDAYNGAQVTMNVWSPSVEVASEFSLSQIWVLAGSFTSDLNSIEAGWQVSPDLYGDNNPRFFTYWTADGYQTTGCYNLLCSGFVQTSNAVALGAAISPVSSYSGSQYDMRVLIWKDPLTGHWWMLLGESTIVGYWPAAIFTHLAGSASLLEWGGEVVNSKPHGNHTTTVMGSGQFAEAGYGEASYMRNIEFVDSTNVLRSVVVGLQTFAEHPNCYDIQSGSNSAWGNFFYYGGPGQNPNCP